LPIWRLDEIADGKSDNGCGGQRQDVDDDFGNEVNENKLLLIEKSKLSHKTFGNGTLETGFDFLEDFEELARSFKYPGNDKLLRLNQNLDTGSKEKMFFKEAIEEFPHCTFKEVCEKITIRMLDGKRQDYWTNQIQHIQQKNNESVAQYFARFYKILRFMQLSIGLDYREPENSKILNFYRGLRSEIKDRLVGLGKPNTLNEYVTQCQEIESNLKELFADSRTYQKYQSEIMERISPYKIGDLVWKKDHDSEKLDLPWVGPYKVKSLGTNSCVIGNDREDDLIVNWRDLKKSQQKSLSE
jgi:hypothetical protein